MEKEGVAATTRELETVARADRAGVTDAAPTSLFLTRQQVVTSWSKRPGDDAFLHGSVLCVAELPRDEFAPALAKALVDTASSLPKATRARSVNGTDPRSVNKAWDTAAAAAATLTPTL